MNGYATVIDDSSLAKCQGALHRMAALAESVLAAERRYHSVVKSLGTSREASRALAKSAECVSQAQDLAAQVAEADALFARIAESNSENGPILIPGTRAVSKAEDAGERGETIEQQLFAMDPAERGALLAKLAKGERQ